MEEAKKQNTELLLPVDVVVAAEFAAQAPYKEVDVADVPADWMILDIGTKSRELFAHKLEPMKLIVWNGPMGVFEMEKFAVGTKALAEALSKTDAISIIGGGDSAAAVGGTSRCRFESRFGCRRR